MNYKQISAGAILFFSFTMLQGCSDDSVSPINYISGKVVNSADYPLPGLKIKTGDKTAVTNVNGVYLIPDVSLPYDLLIIDEKTKNQELLKSVNTSFILVPDFLSQYDPQYKAYININIPSSVITPGKKGKLIYTNGYNVNETTDIISESTRLEIRVPGDIVYKGKIIILLYSVDNTGKIISYDNYCDSADVTAVNPYEQTFDFDEDDFSFNPEERIISGSIKIPSGYNSDNQYFYLDFSKGKANFGIQDSKYSDLTGNDFNIIVPLSLPSEFNVLINNYIVDIPNDKYCLETFSIPSNENTVNLNPRLPADLNSPSNNSPDVNSGTVISHSEGEGSGVYVTRFINTTSSNSSYVLSVVSTENTYQLSELNKFDNVNLKDQNFTWTVQKYGEVSDMSQYLLAYPIDGNRFLSKAEQWSFHTEP